jgi:hypothetical protein
MEAYLTKVEDTFNVSGRGLIIAPLFPLAEFKLDTNETLRVERPDGSEFECEAYFQVPFQSPPPKVIAMNCALLGVEKSSVPVGSKIWIVGKSDNDVKQ